MKACILRSLQGNTNSLSQSCSPWLLYVPFQSSFDLRFFGERALFDSELRTATIQVKSEVAKVLALDRDAFETLLGPLEDSPPTSLTLCAFRQNACQTLELWVPD